MKKRCLEVTTNDFSLKNVFFWFKTTFFNSFNGLLSFLAEKYYRTNMKLPQKASFGPETCEIEPIVVQNAYWFLREYYGFVTFLFKFIFKKNVVFGLQTTPFDSFNVLLSFLAEKWYRTNMKLPQKASLGSEMCEIGPKVWFLASGFCLLRLGEPSGGSWGNPGGPPAVTAFKDLYKNPLEIPKGIPS